MGQIIVANMQASLTMDKSDFDAKRAEAEKEIQALKQQWRDLPLQATSNIGKDAGNVNPIDAEETGHRKRVQMAQEAATQETQAVERVTSAHAAHTQVVEQHVQRQRQAHADAHRERMGQIQEQGAALDSLQSKQAAIQTARAMSGVTDPHRIERSLDTPAPGSREYAQKIMDEAFGVYTPSPHGDATPGNGVDALNPGVAVASKPAAMPAVAVATPAPGTMTASQIDNGTARATIPPEVMAKMQQIASLQGDAGADELYNYFQSAGLPANVILAASEQFPDMVDMYRKQSTPEAVEKQAIATENALAREARGLSSDPVEAAMQRRMKAETRGAAPSGRPARPDDGDEGDGKAGFPFFRYTPAGRGGELSERYQRYQFLNSQEFAPVAAFTRGAGGGAAIEGLTALAGPEVAITAAALALGEGLKKAAEAALDYAKVQVTVSASLNQLPKSVQGQYREAMGGEVDYGRSIGFGEEEIQGAFAGLARQKVPQATIQRILRAAENVDRTGMASFSDITSQFQSGIRGGGMNVGNLGGEFYNNANWQENLQKMEALFGGEAQSRKADADVQLAVAGEELHKSFVDMGMVLVPAIAGIAAFTVGLMHATGGLIHEIGAPAANLKQMMFEDMAARGYDQSTPEGRKKLADEQVSNPVAGIFHQMMANMGILGDPNAAQGSNAFIGPNLPGPGGQGFVGPLNPAQSATARAGAPGGTDASYYGHSEMEISAIKDVSAEVQGSAAAIGGMQDVFTKLVGFHVDLSLVKPQLDNLLEAVQYLQKFWIEAVKGKQSMIQGSDYDFAKTFLDMTGTMESVMSGGSDLLKKIYANTGTMPTEGEAAVIRDRLVTMFNWFEPVAEVAMKGTDRQVAVADLKAWSESTGAMVAMVSQTTDVMAKINAVPIPDSSAGGQVDKAISASVSLIGKITRAVNEAFTTETEHGFGGKVGGVKSTIDPMLAQAAAVVPSLNALMGFAGPALQVIQGMTNLYVPSDEEISKFADASVGVAFKVAARISEKLSQKDYSKGAPFAGQDMKDAFNQAGQASDNLVKFVQVAGGGINAIAGMRNVEIPPNIDSFVDATIGMAQRFADKSASLNPNQLAQIKLSGEALGPAMQAIVGGVTALKDMRDLAEPGPGQMGAFFHNYDILASHATQMDPNTAARIQQGGQAMSATMQALGAGAQALGAVHESVMPNDAELSQFFGTFDSASSHIMALSQRYSQHQADRGMDVGNALSAEFSALSQGADWLGKMHELLVPTKRTVDDIFNLEMGIGDRLMSRAQFYSRDQTKNAEDYGKAMTAIFGGLSSAGDVIEKMPRIHAIPIDMISAFFHDYDLMSEQMTKRAQSAQHSGKLVPEQVSKDIEGEFGAISKAVEAINSVGVVRYDFTRPIDVLFDNMDLMMVQFRSRFTQHKELASKETHDLAVGIGEEMDAINKAIEPMTNMDKASRVGPAMIDAIMRNSKYMIQQFAHFADMPELKGENQARLLSLASVTNEIAGSIKNMVDAVESMSKPQSSIGTQNVLNMLDNVYRRGVSMDPQYATGGAMVGPGGRGMSGGTYNNCVIVNGQIVAQGQDAVDIVRKVTDYAQRQQGGVQVQQPRK